MSDILLTSTSIENNISSSPLRKDDRPDKGKKCGVTDIPSCSDSNFIIASGKKYNADLIGRPIEIFVL